MNKTRIKFMEYFWLGFFILAAACMGIIIFGSTTALFLGIYITTEIAGWSALGGVVSYLVYAFWKTRKLKK